MDLRKLIQEYYRDNRHMQLATVSNGQPWICTVYYATDNDFNLYWTSRRSRQHSIEISTDPKAAVTIVKDIERKQALQIIGSAYEVDNNDILRVHKLYQEKFGQEDYDIEEMKSRNPDGRAYWVFKPSVISLWDEVNFPDNPKQIFELLQKD